MATAEESARAFIGADALAGIGYERDLEVATKAIEHDRAQRRISFDALDTMLNAWETREIDDVSSFIEAWLGYFTDGTEVPEWAKP